MANQIVVSAGAKVRNLDGVLTGTSGVVNSLPINASNGIPQLDVNGKILVSQLPNSVMEYKGTWNAATNTPTLANGTGNQGDVYLCNVAGTVDFGAGPIAFVVGDQVIYSGSIWQRASGATGTVTSVAITESGDSLSITGSPITTSGTINIGFNGTNLQYVNGAGNLTTFPTLITSIGLSMPSAFSVANSPLTANGTIAVTGAGTTAQYIRGDGSLATFPTIATEAQRLITEVYNETGATLTKGTVVYINGGHGNLPTITKAIATGDATSAQTYGIVQTDITNNNNGYVVVIGSLTDLDTQAYANGTQLYLSSTTAGQWTDVKQYAPAHLVYVGIVVRSHPTQGVVEVRIQNGFEMDELHNVSAQSPANGGILQYVTSTGLWTAVAGTTTNIAEGTNLYFTELRARGAISATAPLVYSSVAGTMSIDKADSSTSGYLSAADWTTFNNKQAALSGTGFVKISGTTISYDNSTYYLASNPSAFIALTSLSAGVGISYNNTTGVITNSAPDQTVSLTAGAGISVSGTYPSFTIASTITQYTDALARLAISLTTTGTSGAATYNSTTGVLNIPQYIGGVTSVFGRTGAVVATEGDYSLTQLSDVTITSPTTNQVLKYNGTAWVNDTDANTGTVTSVGLSAPTGFSVTGSPVTSSGTLALAFASGYSLPTTIKQSNWDDAYTFVAAFPTQTGNSGKYLTTDGSSLSWATNPLGTVTSVGLSSATSGVTIGSSPITTSGTITLAIATATTSQNGLLSSTDWTTFNNKQGTITLTTTGTSGAATFSANTLNIPNYGSALSGYLPLTGGTLNTTNTTETLRIINGGTGYGLYLQSNAFFQGDLTLQGYLKSVLYTYTLPSATGTIALTSDIPSLTGYVNTSGTPTTNYLPKFTGASTIGNSQIFDNGSAVGINTSSFTSGYRLEVVGSGGTFGADNNGQLISKQALDVATAGGRFTGQSNRGSLGAIHIEQTTTGADGGYIDFRTSSSGSTTPSAKMRLDASGNLGLGVTPSDWFVVFKALQIGNYGAAISGQTNDEALVLWNNAYPNASNVDTYTATRAANKFQMAAGAFKWFSAPSGTAGNAITFTQAMTLTAAGRLLINTPTESTYQLDVNGTGRFGQNVNITSTTGNSASIQLNRFSNTNSSAILFSTNGTDDWFMGTNALGTNLTDFYFYKYGVGNVFSLSASTGAATFSSSVTANNNVSVIRSGSSLTTLGQSRYLNLSDYYGNTNARMEIGLGYSAATGITNVPALIGFIQTSATNLTYGDLYFATRDVTTDTAPTVRLTIASTGAATFSSTCTATGFFESSDSRLKTLIQDNYQTKGIASITPKLYTKNGKVELGYYAQDFVGVLDSAVSTGGNDMLSLSYREVLVAKVYALEQEIKDLKAKMN